MNATNLVFVMLYHLFGFTLNLANVTILCVIILFGCPANIVIRLVSHVWLPSKHCYQACKSPLIRLCIIIKKLIEDRAVSKTLKYLSTVYFHEI